jgi:protein-disulfide isomerase-like protein with CxxC motif
MVTPVQFHFDPGCPWTWITSRWLVEVAPQRELRVAWQPFSLRYHNKANPDYDWVRDELDAQHPAMRVIMSVRQHRGNEAVGRLYTALGTRIHHDGDEFLRGPGLADAIAAAGLPAEVLDAAVDESWDPLIEESTDQAVSIVGDQAGIPIIAIDGAATIYFGPVLSPAPTGQAALELWDAFATLCRTPGIYEIKRTRNVKPLFTPLVTPLVTPQLD